jgi:hypothetical protein
VALFRLELATAAGQPLPLLILDYASGSSFRLEQSLNLRPTNWSLLSPVTLNSSRLDFVNGLITTHFMRIYRAVPW